MNTLFKKGRSHFNVTFVKLVLCRIIYVKSHVKTVNEERKPFQCKNCAFSFVHVSMKGGSLLSEGSANLFPL